jgi:CRP-like cAMP-binding protein
MKNTEVQGSSLESETKIHNEIPSISSVKNSQPFTSRRDGVFWGDDEKRRDDLEDEKLIAGLTYIFQKANRSSYENEIILKYLSTLSGLVELCKQNSDNYQQLLSNIASVIKYENVPRDRLLFKVGDEGDRFFVIFRGKVSVLVPQCERIEMNEEEYITYLAKLRRNDEQELITKCLSMNYEVFPIDKENFDGHLEKFYSRMWLDRKLDLIKINNDEEDRHSSVFNAKTEISRTLSILSEKKRKFSYKRVLTFKDLQPLDYINIFYTPVKSVEHYINETSPLVHINKSRGLKKYVNVFIYTYIKDYEKGDKFGEIALQNISGKRAAALITVEDCHFGILDKPSFDQCLNQIYDKMKKGNINLLMTTKIFYGWNKNLFIRHIYEFFSYHKVSRNHVLLQENEENSFVYFLKEGEFEFKTKRSLVEINNIVKSLGGVNVNEKRELESKGNIF